jgi:tetratricopeptide (TPR) repeat protein
VRSLTICTLLLLAASAGLADSTSDSPQTAQSEFRAAWHQFLEPYGEAVSASSRQTHQQAREAALPRFEAAVAAAPENVTYRACLGYAYLAAGKYQRANEALREAVALARDDPLLYLLRAQAEATLSQAEPGEKSGEVEPAIRSFREAARLDPDNALALIQAASVAFDADRTDTALGMTDAALERPGMTLYRLGIPADLEADQGTSLKLWQYAQMGQWMELLARAENVVKNIIKLGEAKEKEGDLEAARDHFQKALAVARQIANTRPNMFLTANTGINMMEDSYASLARVAEATEDPEMQRWRGEMGVLSIARGDLYSALQQYVAALGGDVPSSPDELLALQGRLIAFPMLGAGLSPTEEPQPSQEQPRDEEATGLERG